MRPYLPNSVELDHVKAWSKDGADEESNFQLLCLECNRRKHTKDRVDFEIGYAKRVGALGIRKP